MISLVSTVMAIVAIAISVTAEPLPPDTVVRDGFLSRYDDGVMERVIAHNDRINFPGWSGFVARETAELDGYVAIAHCHRRGQFGNLIVDGERYRVMVADCIRPEDVVSGNIFDREVPYIAEVDYALAKRIGVGQRSVWATLEFD